MRAGAAIATVRAADDARYGFGIFDKSKELLIKKRTLQRSLILVCALSSPFLLVLSHSADGQDKALVEAARKEGKVTIFGSLQNR